MHAHIQDHWGRGNLFFLFLLLSLLIFLLFNLHLWLVLCLGSFFLKMEKWGFRYVLYYNLKHEKITEQVTNSHCLGFTHLDSSAHNPPMERMGKKLKRKRFKEQGICLCGQLSVGFCANGWVSTRSHCTCTTT